MLEILLALSIQGQTLLNTQHETYFSVCKTESTARVVWTAHRDNGMRSAQMMFGSYKSQGECGVRYMKATVTRVIDEGILDFGGQKRKAFFVELTEGDETYYGVASVW